MHLGCGDIRLPGFLNIDRRETDATDVVRDVRLLNTVAEPGTVDLIYACHVLDHFTRWEYQDVLRYWRSLLRPGGVLRLAVPDFESIVALYQEGVPLEALTGLLCARQDYQDNVRHVLFDYAMLGGVLMRCGFSQVNHYDWRLTDHAHIDDFSQAYWPHMDKEHGRLVSLNVEAIR